MSSVGVQAGEPVRPALECETLPIGLTAEEMERLDEIGIGHRATAPPATPIRQCAEW